MNETRVVPAASGTRNKLLLGGGALLVVAGVWFLATRSAPPPRPAAAHEEGAAKPVPEPTVRRSAARRAVPAPPASAGPDRPSRMPEDGHPHPLTSEHARLYRQTDLLHDAWKSIQAGRYDAGRALVAAHRKEYPGQRDDMNEGLELVAECMERPGEGVVERARRFHAERTASMMRRRIRRHCIEPWERGLR